MTRANHYDTVTDTKGAVRWPEWIERARARYGLGGGRMETSGKWMRLRREAAETDRLREERIRREMILAALEDDDPLMVLADRCRALEARLHDAESGREAAPVSALVLAALQHARYRDHVHNADACSGCQALEEVLAGAEAGR